MKIKISLPKKENFSRKEVEELIKQAWETVVEEFSNYYSENIHKESQRALKCWIKENL